MIRVQVIEGTWQVLGKDLYPGVYPEGVVPTWGPSGPESLGFTLHRPPNRVHADLLPYTPVEWYPTGSAVGEPLWSGYTQQAPPGGFSEATNVSCVGWHYYRDDMPRSAVYVHEALNEWVDVRSRHDLSLSALASWPTRPIVETGGGAIILAWPKDGSIDNARSVGVVLDLGPLSENWTKRITVGFEWVGGANNVSNTLFVRTADAVDYLMAATGGVAGVNQDSLASITNTAAGTASYTAPTRRRLWGIFFYRNGGTFSPLAADEGVRIKTLRVYNETTYESGNSSAFVASTGVIHARDSLCPLLSADNSKIATTTFPIRHSSWPDDATMRERTESWNAYHGYRSGVDADRRVFFLPQPSVPRLYVDASAAGVDYQPTSTNDGTEIYNHVSVRGRSGSGEELRTDRYTGEYVANAPPSPVGFTNGSFDTTATGWSTGVSRITTEFDTAPGAGFATGQSSYSATMTGGTFLRGLPYVAEWRMRTNGLDYLRIQFGTSTDYFETNVKVAVIDTYETFRIAWIPKADTASGSVTWRISNTLPAAGYYFDTAVVYAPTATILDQRRRIRSFTLNVASPTDLVAMGELARVWLLAHQTVPHRASLTINSDAVVDLVSNRHVPADTLGRYYGEMIRIGSVPDPDTGALMSRDGIITSAQGYEPAQLAIDTERRSLEALMARMGVVQGNT